MEMNKDEAIKCNNIAKIYLNKKNYLLAIKFFEKSLKLYPLPGVEALKNKAKEAMIKDNEKSSHSIRNNIKKKTKIEKNDIRKYTIEQEKIVLKIKSCKTHYDVLGISKNDVNENDIKKAYKKLALKLHPDKNSAPGAEEAFKAVGKAFAVLSDPERKADYDKYGDDSDNRTNASQSRNRSRYAQEMSPEDIFNAFFGSGFTNSNVYTNFNTTDHPRANTTQINRTGLQQFIQFLPIIIITLISFISFPENTPVFSMKQTRYYPIQRQTGMETVVKGIPYFVTNDFDRKYSRSWHNLLNIERAVEEHYARELDNTCTRQRLTQKKMVEDARKETDENKRENYMRKALNYKLTSCDKLKALQNNRYYFSN